MISLATITAVPDVFEPPRGRKGSKQMTATLGATDRFDDTKNPPEEINDMYKNSIVCNSKFHQIFGPIPPRNPQGTTAFLGETRRTP